MPLSSYQICLRPFRWLLCIVLLAAALLPAAARAQAGQCCFQTVKYGSYRGPWITPREQQSVHNYSGSGFTGDSRRSSESSCIARPSTGCLTRGEGQCLGATYSEGGNWSCPNYRLREEEEVPCSDIRCGGRTLLNAESCTGRSQTDCTGGFAGSCFWHNSECLGRVDNRICYKLPQNLCERGADGATPGSQVCVWKTETGKCINKIQAGAITGIDYSKEGAFPKCGFDGTCDSLNDLLKQQVGWANYAFGFVGVIGFVSFVVGGITMITSFGNPEKFKKGMQLMVAAVIGLTIAFSAYLIVKFVLDALGVTPEFRGV